MKTILKLLIALAIALIATQALPKKAAYQGNQVAQAAQETQTPEPTVEPTPEATPAPTVAPTPVPPPIATPAPKPVYVAQSTKPVVSGTHEQWMTAAGIPQSDWQYVEVLVQRESSWNPSAFNKSSGSCSLVQALPCSKIPGNWQDPVNALRWGNSYVVARYTTWQNALAHSFQYNWY